MMESLDTVRKLIQPGDFMMNTNPRRLQTLSTVHLSGNNIRVPVPPIRAFQCTLDIHQTIETSFFTAAIAGDTNCNISGQYTHFDRQIGFSVSQHCECAKTTALIKQEKCSQVPTQRIKFLGSLINSTDMLQSVPSEKLQNNQAECRKAY